MNQDLQGWGHNFQMLYFIFQFLSLDSAQAGQREWTWIYPSKIRMR